jgi:hypothetical protein
VAFGVVHRFQPPDVDVREHKRAVVAAGTRQLALECLGEPASVEHSSELIGPGRRAQRRQLPGLPADPVR